MNVIVFGATGTIGRHIVRLGLDQGHRVTAFARRPDALGMDHPELRLLAGDVLDADAVAAAVPGHDAVIVALGAGMKGGVRAPGTRNVVRAMEQVGVRRLIALSTIGAGDSRHHLDFYWKYVMFGLLLRRAMADHEAQEACIRESSLDWTIARPAAFTDEAARGDYRHGTLEGERLALKLPGADVAAFMLDQLRDLRYLHAAPGLSC